MRVLSAFISVPLTISMGIALSVALSSPAEAADLCQDAFLTQVGPQSLKTMKFPKLIFQGNPHEQSHRRKTVRESVIGGSARLLGLNARNITRDAILKQSEARRLEFLLAINRGEAMLVHPVVRAKEIIAVDEAIKRLGMDEIYDLVFLAEMMRPDDAIYAVNGELVRVRPSDQSVFIIPSELNLYLSRAMKYPASVRNASWISGYFLPRFPEYGGEEGLGSLLATRFSSWRTTRTGVQVDLQAEASFFEKTPDGLGYRSGFVFVHIDFQDKQTLIWVRPRPEGRGSDYFEAQERNARTFIEMNAQKGGLLGVLFKHAQNGEATVIPAGSATEAAVRVLRKAMYFYQE